MNRRTLFQTCAAGLAFLLGGNQLPAKIAGPHPVETCNCGTCRARRVEQSGRAIFLVVNGGSSTVCNGNVLEWVANGNYKSYDSVKNADLTGALAGIALDDAQPGQWFGACSFGTCEINTTR